jgi:hypothetical protein
MTLCFLSHCEVVPRLWRSTYAHSLSSGKFLRPPPHSYLKHNLGRRLTAIWKPVNNFTMGLAFGISRKQTLQNICSPLVLIRGLHVVFSVRSKIKFFWDAVPCSHVKADRRFGCAYCLHHHSSPWWWRQYTPLKRRWTLTWLHGAISQKTKLHTRCRENLKSHIGPKYFQAVCTDIVLHFSFKFSNINMI